MNVVVFFVTNFVGFFKKTQILETMVLYLYPQPLDLKKKKILKWRTVNLKLGCQKFRSCAQLKIIFKVSSQLISLR